MSGNVLHVPNMVCSKESLHLDRYRIDNLSSAARTKFFLYLQTCFSCILSALPLSRAHFSFTYMVCIRWHLWPSHWSWIFSMANRHLNRISSRRYRASPTKCLCFQVCRSCKTWKWGRNSKYYSSLLTSKHADPASASGRKIFSISVM